MKGVAQRAHDFGQRDQMRRSLGILPKHGRLLVVVGNQGKRFSLSRFAKLMDGVLHLLRDAHGGARNGSLSPPVSRKTVQRQALVYVLRARIRRQLEEERMQKPAC